MELKERNILVTGGGGYGVGEGVCNALISFGARLIVNEINEEKAKIARGKYPGCIVVTADIRKQAELENMFLYLEKEVGVIHGLVNNAGVGLSKPAHEASKEEFDGLYDVDIRGVWMVSKLFVRQLLQNNTNGNIVNVSSVHAHATMPRYAIYASAKSAVEGLTRGMAIELGKYNIRVNAIAPGYVHAEQNYALISTWTDNPKQWVQDYIENEQAIPIAIQAIDCGNAAAFLLSDLSKSITGQTLCVDNGDTIKLVGSLSK
ncbi:MAG: SDR family oxidoreductase [Chitinophagaceae bacterium]|nr:MAG: SDR family oxidoreductase [Chitinophagaceae bacterium]